MKNTSRMKKVCSAILCILMVMNVFVSAMFTVSAATRIEVVSMSGIDVPKPGATPDYTADGTGSYYPTYKYDDTYIKNGVTWFDVTDKNNKKQLKPDQTFVEGHKYEVRIILEAASGYEFAVSSGNSGVVARVNGNHASTYGFTGIDFKKNVGVSYSFGECKNEYITDIVANCVTPKAGQMKISLQNPASVDESRPYYVNGYLWTNLKSDGNTSYMNDTDKFTAGKTYRCEIYLRAKEGYVFNAANGDYFGNATVNGKDAGYFVADMGEGSVIVMTLHYDVTIPEAIKTLSVSNIDLPQPGKSADFSALVNGTGYKITSIKWFDMTQTPPKAVTSFESGRKYQLNVNVETVGNYVFAAYEDITATVNGKAATLYSGVTETTATFGGDYYSPISTVAVTGIDAPVAGAKPDTTAQTPDTSYQVKQVKWSVVNKRGSTLTLKDMAENAVFEEGKMYQVTVYLERLAPYAFLYNSKDQTVQLSSGTVNGKTANTFGSTSATQAYVTCMYTVSKTPTEIHSVAVSGIDAPVVGGKPDMTATVADSTYTVKSVNWYALTEAGAALKENMLTADSVFEAGKKYRVAVTLERVAPYVFYCDPEDDGIQNITASVNGKEVKPGSSYSETEALLSLDFEKMSAPVVTPDDKLKFKADSTFTADHTAKEANITKETSASKVSEQIANEYFTVNAKTDAPFVGTGVTIDVKDSKGKVLSTYTVLIKGDVNGDGKIEPADARLALRASVNLETLAGIKAKAADFNGDGTNIEPADARLILRKAVGLD